MAAPPHVDILTIYLLKFGHCCAAAAAENNKVVRKKVSESFERKGKKISGPLLLLLVLAVPICYTVVVRAKRGQ